MSGKLPGHIALEGGGYAVPTGPSERELQELAESMPAPGSASHEACRAAYRAVQQAPAGFQSIVQSVAQIHYDTRRTPEQKTADSADAAARVGQRYREALARAAAALAEAQPEGAELAADCVTRADRLLAAKVDQYRQRLEIEQKLARGEFNVG